MRKPKRKLRHLLPKAKPSLNQTFFDYGKINEKGGPVKNNFRFKNTGNAPVTITKVNTSCGCTSTSWTTTAVAPGEYGVVTAVYDPDGRQGPFEKEITVETNGEPQFVSLKVRGVVYASKLSQYADYKYRYGNLAVPTNVISLNKVPHNGYDSTEIAFFNLSNRKINFYRIESPPNITVFKPFDNLEPNNAIKMKVKYLPKYPLEFGPVKQDIKIYTNDDTLPIKVITINANIVEDFGKMDKKALKEAPKLTLSSNTIDLGNVKLFESPSGTFMIKNKGKNPLIIRRVIRGCNCLNPELPNREIKKGESVALKVTWSNVNMSGPDAKTLKLITNDPTQPEITLTIKVNAVE